MAPPLVTYEVAKAKIGTLPTLAPRPNSTNIRDLRRAIDDALSGIPSNQSAEHGYAGLAAQPAIYALRTATAWQDAVDQRQQWTPRKHTTNRCYMTLTS